MQGARAFSQSPPTSLEHHNFSPFQLWSLGSAVCFHAAASIPVTFLSKEEPFSIDPLIPNCRLGWQKCSCAQRNSSPLWKEGMDADQKQEDGEMDFGMEKLKEKSSEKTDTKN